MGKPTLSSQELTEYAEVATRIGMASQGAFLTEKLKHCLQEEGISIYGVANVIKYLDAKLGPDWEWQGLREEDTAHLSGWHTGEVDGARRIDFSKATYSRPIPLPVLLTVEKIHKAVPEVHFYVSAPKESEGDPFLMVTRQNMGSYIVERWEEPNFRDR